MCNNQKCVDKYKCALFLRSKIARLMMSIEVDTVIVAQFPIQWDTLLSGDVVLGQI